MCRAVTRLGITGFSQLVPPVCFMTQQVSALFTMNWFPMRHRRRNLMTLFALPTRIDLKIWLNRVSFCCYQTIFCPAEQDMIVVVLYCRPHSILSHLSTSSNVAADALIQAGAELVSLCSMNNEQHMMTTQWPLQIRPSMFVQYVEGQEVSGHLVWVPIKPLLSVTAAL